MGRKQAAEPVKYCGQCGEQMHRKVFTGRLEDMSRFKDRRYCGVSCMGKAMVRDEVSRSMHHKRAQKFKRAACELCGTTDDLHVHHKDLDPTNDDSTNLQTLCSSCHLKMHWKEGVTHKAKERQTCRLCDKPAKGLGLCSKHYFRQYRRRPTEEIFRAIEMAENE